MKTISKILIILFAAILLGGLFYGAVTAFSSSSDQSSAPEALSNGEFPADAQFVPRDDMEKTDGIQFPADAVKNLVLISLVSVIYLNATKWLGRRKSVSGLNTPKTEIS